MSTHSAFAVKQVAAVQTVAPLDQVAMVLATVFQYTVVTMHYTHHVSALNIRVAPTHSFTPSQLNPPGRSVTPFASIGMFTAEEVYGLNSQVSGVVGDCMLADPANFPPKCHPTAR